MNDAVETILKELLAAMDVTYTEITQSAIAGQIIFSIHINGEARNLIGAHGDTMQALDILVKKIAEKRLDPEMMRDLHFSIDVNDYRTQQIKELQAKALVMAERARSFQYDVELSPMSAYERLIVHSTLQGESHIKTESQGEGRERRVVIRYVSAE